MIFLNWVLEAFYKKNAYEYLIGVSFEMDSSYNFGVVVNCVNISGRICQDRIKNQKLE